MFQSACVAVRIRASTLQAAALLTLLRTSAATLCFSTGAMGMLSQSCHEMESCAECPSLSSDIHIADCRLGEGYATAGPCEVDESKKRIWYAGGSEIDKVGCSYSCVLFASI